MWLFGGKSKAKSSQPVQRQISIRTRDEQGDTAEGYQQQGFDPGQQQRGIGMGSSTMNNVEDILEQDEDSDETTSSSISGSVGGLSGRRMDTSRNSSYSREPLDPRIWSNVTSPGFTSRMVQQANGTGGMSPLKEILGNQSPFSRSPNGQLKLGQLPVSAAPKRTPSSLMNFPSPNGSGRSLFRYGRFSRVAKRDSKNGTVFVKVAPIDLKCIGVPVTPSPTSSASGGMNFQPYAESSSQGLGGIPQAGLTQKFSRLWPNAPRNGPNSGAPSYQIAGPSNSNNNIMEALANRKRSRDSVNSDGNKSVRPSSSSTTPIMSPEDASKNSKRVKFVNDQELRKNRPLTFDPYDDLSSPGTESMTSKSILEQMNQTEKRFFPDSSPVTSVAKKSKIMGSPRGSSTPVVRKRRVDNGISIVEGNDDEFTEDSKKIKTGKFCHCNECYNEAAGLSGHMQVSPIRSVQQTPITSPNTTLKKSVTFDEISLERHRQAKLHCDQGTETDMQSKPEVIIRKATRSSGYITKDKYDYDREQRIERFRRILGLRKDVQETDNVDGNSSFTGSALSNSFTMPASQPISFPVPSTSTNGISSFASSESVSQKIPDSGLNSSSGGFSFGTTSTVTSEFSKGGFSFGTTGTTNTSTEQSSQSNSRENTGFGFAQQPASTTLTSSGVTTTNSITSPIASPPSTSQTPASTPFESSSTNSQQSSNSAATSEFSKGSFSFGSVASTTSSEFSSTSLPNSNANVNFSFTKQPDSTPLTSHGSTTTTTNSITNPITSPSAAAHTTSNVTASVPFGLSSTNSHQFSGIQTSAGASDVSKVGFSFGTTGTAKTSELSSTSLQPNSNANAGFGFTQQPAFAALTGLGSATTTSVTNGVTSSSATQSTANTPSTKPFEIVTNSHQASDTNASAGTSDFNKGGFSFGTAGTTKTSELGSTSLQPNSGANASFSFTQQPTTTAGQFTFGSATGASTTQQNAFGSMTNPSQQPQQLKIPAPSEPFGSSATPSTTGQFTFGSGTGSSGSQQNAFGSITSVSEQPLQLKTEASSLTFGSNSVPATTGQFTFGSAIGTSTGQQNTFGSMTNASQQPLQLKTQASSAPFGSNSITSTGGQFTFGSVTGSTATQQNAFGSMTNGPQQSQQLKTQASSVPFGSNSMTSTTGQFTFGSATGSSTTQQNAFGSMTNGPQQSQQLKTQASSVPFGSNSTTSTTGPFTFGSGTGSSISQPNAFGSMNNTSQQPQSNNNLFGGVNSSSTSFGSGQQSSTSQNLFGTSTSQPQSTTFGTGSTQPNTFGTGSTQPNAFGTGSTQSNAFGTGSTVGGGQGNLFGASASTNQTNTFGTSQPPANIFGSQGNVSSNQQSLFGSTTGTSANQPNAFGSATSGSSQPSAFGTSGQNTFGSLSNNQGSSSASTFGTSNNNASFGSATPTPSFNFGGSQPQPSTGGFAFGQQNQQPQQQQQTNGASQAFQFGQTSQLPSQGAFNFSAQAQAPGAFGVSPAPAANAMFSLGTPTAAPRRRDTRMRRNR